MDAIKKYFSSLHINKSKLGKNTLNFIFLVAIAFMAAFSVISLIEFRNLLSANNWVLHTYTVINNVDNVLYDIADLEAHQRGYLVTGDKLFLNKEAERNNDIRITLDSLKILTADKADQTKRIVDMRNLIEERVSILNQVSALKEQNQLYNAQGMKVFYRGHELSDQIKVIGSDIKAVEENLLEKRNINLIEKANLIDNILLIGNSISVITLLIAYFLFNHELRKRREAEELQKNLKLQLTSVIEGASDMIAAVDKNYRFFLFNRAYQEEFEMLFNKKITVGMSIEEALAHKPESLQKLLAVWIDSMTSKEYTRKIGFNSRSGRHDYEINSSLVKDDKGEVLGAVHIIRNVTNQVIEQEQLKAEYDALHRGMEELKIRNEKITLLVEMSDVMLACSSINELCQVAGKYCEKILNFSSGLIYIMHPSKNYLEVYESWGNPAEQNPTFTYDRCWALRLGRIHNAAPGRNDLVCDHVLNPKHDELIYLCVPLMAQNDIYGLLYFEIAQSQWPNNVLPENEKLLINAFAELTALSLANVRLRENLHFQSIRDPLTSLYNRRYLEEFLLKQLHQSERTHSPLAVLMLDLDHFKRINDFYGHDAGDLALKEIGKILNSSIRAGDLACRYGGEEFLLVLFNTDAKNAKQRAEALREEVSHIHIKYGTQHVGPIQISIGIAVFPEDGQTSAELIETADKALYEAKNSGRNKSVLYADMK